MQCEHGSWSAGWVGFEPWLRLEPQPGLKWVILPGRRLRAQVLGSNVVPRGSEESFWSKMTFLVKRSRYCKSGVFQGTDLQYLGQKWVILVKMDPF